MGQEAWERRASPCPMPSCPIPTRAKQLAPDSCLVFLSSGSVLENVRKRVDRSPVHPHFVVHVGSRRAPAVSEKRDLVAAPDTLALLDQGLSQVAVPGLE